MSTQSKLKGIVSCTKSQYDALTVKNGDKIYMIIDESGSSGGGAPVYRHSVHMYGGSSEVFMAFVMIISKRAEEITSLADFKAVLGNTFRYPCNWYIEDGTLCGAYMTETTFFSFNETTTRSWSVIDGIIDQVTEV